MIGLFELCEQRFRTLLQAARHENEVMQERHEEDQEAKGELQRSLAKANTEVTLWRSKYEIEGVQRAEELEEAKRLLAERLDEAEKSVESTLTKRRVRNHWFAYLELANHDTRM